MSRQIHVAKLFAAALAAVLAALALTLASSNATNAQIGGLSVDPVLQENISALGAGDATQAILTYDENPTAEEVAAVEETGVAVHTFDELPMLAIQGNAAQLGELLSLDTLGGVRGIFANERLEYFLDESVPLIGADAVNEDPGFTGEGVGVAVIDSGVDGTHGDVRFPERTVQNVKILGDNIFTGQTIALENQPNTDTSSGHGTHVASTVGGDGTESGGRYAGVAPESDIIGIGAGDALFILYALESFDYALENQEEYNIQVISNSYGTSGEFAPEDPMNVATKAAHDAGMTVVFASGNSGPEEDTLNPYSVAPWVIGVAAGEKDGQTLAEFSSRGIPGDELYHPTLTAPGVDIVAARSATCTVCATGADTDLAGIPPEFVARYATLSGTSMATPHVSGVAALMEEANPEITPDETKGILAATANPMPYEEFEAGAGYLDARAAVERAIGGGGQEAETPATAAPGNKGGKGKGPSGSR
ncbi:MAG: S8 family serine peptidase [Rubrobacter sp.]|nr:S8 family serine peptidase [Rubrobacter sp.]